jgi:alpha-galactosidase
MVLDVRENGLHMTFLLEQGQVPVLAHWGNTPMAGEFDANPYFYGIQEIQVAGESALWHLGVTTAATLPGGRMGYTGHREVRNECGRCVQIDTLDAVTGLAATMVYQFFDGIPVVRCQNILENRGQAPLDLEIVSTLVHPAVAELSDDVRMLIPHNSWQQEGQWKEMPLRQLGSNFFVNNTSSGKRVQLRSIGSWSSGEYLPMGCLRNVTRGSMTFWQIVGGVLILGFTLWNEITPKTAS